MEGTPRRDETLVQVLTHQQNWLDRRHLKTLAWRMVGLIQAGNLRLTAWLPSGPSRALGAQSTVRRLTHWLEHARIAVPALSGPLRQQALAEWSDPRV